MGGNHGRLALTDRDASIPCRRGIASPGYLPGLLSGRLWCRHRGRPGCPFSSAPISGPAIFQVRTSAARGGGSCG